MKLSPSVLLLVAAFATVQAAAVSSNNACTRPNNRGEGKGLGWNGYCCKDSDDCKDTCIKGVCNGKANPKFASPITTTKKTKATTTKKSGSTTCTRPNNRGEGKGLGWNGYCCKDSDDCKDACIKGVCNGKANPKFAKPIATTTVNPKYATPI
ncbi:unnamed protein product [Rhizopus stolonifer]